MVIDENAYELLKSDYSKLLIERDKILDELTLANAQNSKTENNYHEYQEMTARDIASKIKQVESLQKQTSEMTAQLSIMAGQIKSAIEEKNATAGQLEALKVKFEVESEFIRALKSEVEDLTRRLSNNLKGYKRKELIKAFFGIY